MSVAKDKVFPFGFIANQFDVAMNCNGEFFVNGAICDDPHTIVENLKMAGKLFFEEEEPTFDKLKDEETSGYYGLLFREGQGQAYRKVP